MNVRKQTKQVAKGLLITLLLVTFILYYPPFAHGWVGDDYVQLGYVREVVKRPFTFLHIFHPTWTFWYYRPLQNVWFTFGELLFGQQPELFYAVQIGVHLLIVSLVFRIARQIGLHPYVAVGSAALVAIHGHHVDVVTWISAIAIVLAALFSLVAVSLFLDYLKRPLPTPLILTTIACILALLSHEETIVLPPFLLLLLILHRWKSSGAAPPSKLVKQFSKAEIGVFIFLFVVVIAYIVMQIMRPNATIDLSSSESSQWLSLLSPDTFASFWQSSFYRFTFLGAITSLTGLRSAVFVLGSLALLGLALWYGNAIVRVGFLWAALHLAFIYVVLWSQKPEFYAGRHIYNALPGVALAIGAGLQQGIGAVSGQWSAVSRKKRKRKRLTAHLLTPTLLLPLIIIPILLHQRTMTLAAQAIWLADVTEEQQIQAPMMEIMPTVVTQTHVFANRFPITPKFLRSVVYVWYGTMTPSPGGPLSKLLDSGLATSDYYVFDYENGRLFNLMPELQDHAQTKLLLADPITHELRVDGQVSSVSREIGAVKVTGPENARRLSLQMTPLPGNTGWAVQTYFDTIPANSIFAFGYLPAEDLHYRVWIQPSNGASEMLWESDIETGEMWQDVAIGMERWGETAVKLQLEVQFTGAGNPPAATWSNPRISTN
jgi:hypothetical protein